MSFNVDRPTSGGRPKLRWKDVVNVGLASDRSDWRNVIRSVTQQIALQPTMNGTKS